MNSADAFVRDLVYRIPALKSAYKEHMEANDELLAHVLMADITRFAVSSEEAALGGSREAQRIVAHLLSSLEHYMELADPCVVEVISASFLENLDLEDPTTAALISEFGPALSARLRQMNDDYLGSPGW